MNHVLCVVILAALVGCGDKKQDAAKPKDDAQTAPGVAPVALPALGVDAIKRMGFGYGEGAKAYTKAVAAYDAKPRDWDAVRSNCEAALQKDPFHFDAHRVLASALAHAGEHAAAVDHLVTALAGDYFKYGPVLGEDADLKAFFATAHGKAVEAAAAKIRDEYAKRIGTGLWLVARRSAYKWPKEGVQPSSSRGEVYAFDRETRRYFRITHTDHRAAAFVRSASGGEVAVLGFDKIDRPKPDTDVAPTLARAWLVVIDTKEWKQVGKRVQLGAAREVALGYGAGGQLLVSTAPAAGRWGVGDATVSSVDKATGKLTKVATALPVPRVVFSLEEGRRMRPVDGIVATWAGDPPTAPTLAVEGGAPIRVPETGQASQHALAVSPDKTRLAFATAVDPCAETLAPSLYVAETKTGTLKHLLTAKSRFATRWLDANTLAYEDGDGGVRLWDAATGRQTFRIENKPGVALDVLSLATAPLCKGTPPVVEPAGPDDGSDEPPMPPEEPASPGPITTPR